MVIRPSKQSRSNGIGEDAWQRGSKKEAENGTLGVLAVLGTTTDTQFSACLVISPIVVHGMCLQGVVVDGGWRREEDVGVPPIE